jgi:hypothetical protein
MKEDVGKMTKVMVAHCTVTIKLLLFNWVAKVMQLRFSERKIVAGLVSAPRGRGCHERVS